MNNKNYYLSAILSFLIWGVFSVPLKMMSAYEAGQILFFRIGFAVLLLAVFFFLFNRKEAKENFEVYKSFTKQKKIQTILLTIGGGLLLTANWLIFIYVVNSVNIKTATFSYFICPVLTAVLGFLILKEKLGKLQWIAVLMCAASCVLIGRDSVSELAYSLVIAATYAFYLITQRRNNHFNKLFVLLVQLTAALMVIAPFYSLLVGAAPAGAGFYFAVAGISLVFTIIPLFLNLFALKGLNSATIGILMYINPMLNFTLGVLYFDEKVSATQWISYSIIAAALVLFNSGNIIKINKKLQRRVAEHKRAA